MSRRGRRESLDTPHPSHSWLPVCLHRRPVLDISSPLVSLTIVRAHSSPSSLPTLDHATKERNVRAHSSPSSLPTLDHAGRRTPRGLRYGLSNSYSSILAAFCPGTIVHAPGIAAADGTAMRLWQKLTEAAVREVERAPAGESLPPTSSPFRPRPAPPARDPMTSIAEPGGSGHPTWKGLAESPRANVGLPLPTGSSRREGYQDPSVRVGCSHPMPAHA